MVSNSRLLSKFSGLLAKLSFLDEPCALLTLEGLIAFLLQTPKDWLANTCVGRASAFSGVGNILISN